MTAGTPAAPRCPAGRRAAHQVKAGEQGGGARRGEARRRRGEKGKAGRGEVVSFRRRGGRQRNYVIIGRRGGVLRAAGGHTSRV